jgi:hypothetical protein
MNRWLRSCKEIRAGRNYLSQSRKERQENKWESSLRPLRLGEKSVFIYSL